MTISMIDFAGVFAIIMAMISRKFRQLLMYGISRIIFVFIRKTYIHRSLGNAFLANMVKKGYKVKKFSGELYGEGSAFIRPRNEVQHLLYKDVQSNVQLFYGNGWPILVSGTPLTYHKDYVKSYAYVIYSLRWSVDVVNMLNEATEACNADEDGDTEIDTNRFVVKHVSGGRFIREATGKPDKPSPEERANERELRNPMSPLVPVKWKREEIGGQDVAKKDTFAMMSLNQELLDFTEEVEFWHKNREWYEERGIPHRRGALFKGQPGTGKTLFTRALAEKLNMPLIVFNLASMSDLELISAWNQILPGRIALFEDFDTIFHGRESIGNPELHFEVILNLLDGVDKKQGIFTIITTNHPEKLDPAICQNGLDEDGIPSRPGRIDKVIEFLPLNREGRVKLAMRIVKDEKLAEKVVNEGVNDSAAALTERAFRAAIDTLFEQRKAAKTNTNGSNGVVIHKTEEANQVVS